MLNIPDKLEMSAERFIQTCAKLMANRGMPHMPARVLAYILLQSQPVGLDRIAADLEISKASAWGATRHLEQAGQVERIGEQGSKRILYVPAEDFARSMFSYSNFLSRLGILMNQGADLASGDLAAQRLRERSEFYLAIHESIEDTMTELLTERRQAAAE